MTDVPGFSGDGRAAVKYRTIVIDPPWPYADTWRSNRIPNGAINDGRRIALPFATMSLAEIVALPVRQLAADECHLYLWATNRYLRAAFDLIEAWGFHYSQTLVWAKTPMGYGAGGAFAQTAEFILFAWTGALGPVRKRDSVWFNWPRTAQHSRKPEHFLDMVEQVSPGPYVEMFARRHRLGWDVWGNESANTAALEPSA